MLIELAHRRDTGPELLSYREWLAGELGLLVARWRGRRTVRRVNRARRARHRALVDSR